MSKVWTRECLRVLTRQDTLEIFKISVPLVAPGFATLFRERIQDLGPGSTTDRQGLEAVCGSRSAANQFLDKASKIGALVPEAWGSYRVASEETLHLIARVDHPVFQRFISWSRHLPEIAEEEVTFVAPPLWKETALNLEDSMPLFPLSPDQQAVSGHPPQWDAFYMDTKEAREWELHLGEEAVGTFKTPGSTEVRLILMASLDPRWRAAAAALGTPEEDRLGSELDRLDLDEAPRGEEDKKLGLGLPQRRRLLAPRWYMESVRDRAIRYALGELADA